FNRPREVLRAVRSVLAQDFADLEILVVDDNPPDSEARRLTAEALAGLDSRIVHVKSAGSLGGAGARNAGIAAARGAFVAFLDDDDEWLPGKLSRQLALFDSLSDEVCSVDTGFFEIDERRGTRREVRPALRGDIFEDLLVKHKGRAPKLSSMLCRTAALRAVGMFDPSLPARQDLDLYLRLARHYRFDFVPEPLVNKYIHGSGRISAVSANKIRGFALLYEKYRADLAVRPALHRRYLRRHAFWLAKGGKPGQAALKFLKSLAVR
ncbi:MAG: glycosyltransferase family 2 protein, partial [Hyphomicrobiales bacterium]